MDAKAERQLGVLLDRHFGESGAYDLLDASAGLDIPSLLGQLRVNGEQNAAAPPDECSLELRVVGCRSILGPVAGKVLCSFLLDGTRHVTPAAHVREEAADVAATMFFPLKCGAGKTLLDHCGAPLDCLLLAEDEAGLRSSLCEAAVEWRGVLSEGRLSVSVELKSGGVSVPGAVLDLKLACHSLEGALVSPAEVAHHLRAEEQTRVARVLAFSRYARDGWWAAGGPAAGAEDVLLCAPAAAAAAAAAGGSSPLPVTAFVAPLPGGAALPTPLHAAHFASLFRHVERRVAADVMGGARPQGEWGSLHSVLATGSCTLAERCCLLCSLLLAFSLDAWVAYGTANGEERTMWVVTQEGCEVVCWEPLTGARRPLRECSMLTVRGLFNDAKVLVNRQAGGAAVCSYATDEAHLWMPADTTQLAQIDKPPRPRLRQPLENEGDVGKHLETKLAFALAEYRDALGLRGSVLCSGEVHSIVGQYLWSHEVELLTKKPAGAGGLFEDACNFVIPSSHVLTAQPRHYAHANESLILSHLLAFVSTKRIVETARTDTSVVVRCRVTLFPDGMASTWVVVAAMHRSDAT